MAGRFENIFCEIYSSGKNAHITSMSTHGHVLAMTVVNQRRPIGYLFVPTTTNSV